MSFEIITVAPRWYCAWVTRAIRILDEAIKKFGEKIYLNHEIIHNKYIIEYYKRKWVIFEGNLDKIPENVNLVISAHGIGPKTMAKLIKKGLNIIDATCPLVKKVHIKAKTFLEKWKKIIYIWKNWHQEALWVLENSKDNIFLVQKLEDIENLNFEKEQSLAILTQTTLSTLETKKIIEKLKEKFNDIELQKDDICYATTNRQEAVIKLSEICDLIIIIWSKNSSNSNKLREIWEKYWTYSIILDSYEELDLELIKKYRKIWISSWASAPEKLVQDLVAFLKKKWWILKKEIVTKEENIVFS